MHFVVARGMGGKCCVSGCSEIIIDEEVKTLTVGDQFMDLVTLIS